MTDYIIKTYKGETAIKGMTDYQSGVPIEPIRSLARKWYMLGYTKSNHSTAIWTVVLKVNKNTKVAEPYGYVNEYIGADGKTKIGWWSVATGKVHNLKEDGSLGPARDNPYKKKVTSKSKFKPAPFGL